MRQRKQVKHMNTAVLALDQGTTSSRAILFGPDGRILGKGQYPIRQYYPQSGWVEHDAEEIWQTTCRAASDACAAASGYRILGIGITNQRETAVLWDRKTGKPLFHAIVWQCRRTAPLCGELEKAGYAETITAKTGLRIDAYFSGTKLKWLLDTVPDARERALRGEILFGTVESWLIWKLTGGKVHVTDVSNASRTMLFNIHEMRWDSDLCAMLDIPMNILPEPVGNSAVYGTVADGIPGLEPLAGVPVCGAAGDQQAALFGQGCFSVGDTKNTYGTGCFTLMNTGANAVTSRNGLLTTVAWDFGGKTVYALEGSVFNGGSTIQWLRDELRLFETAPDCDRLAESVPDTGGVYLVPAFTGLGAPYWDMYARGIITGLNRGTNRAHIARAALEAIAYQVTDLVRAMSEDAGVPLTSLRVDGGASVSNIMMQIQADLLRIPVDRPQTVETTAFGAAALAGLACGLWKDPGDIRKIRRIDRIFLPVRDAASCEADYAGWRSAVRRAGSATE